MSQVMAEIRGWFLESMVLPADGLQAISRVLRRAGGQIGEPLLADPAFVRCDLPDGWRIVCTDRPATMLLADETGRVRAEITLTVDGGERRGTIRAEQRFEIRLSAGRALQNASVAVVYDDGRSVFETASILFSPQNSADRFCADEMSVLAARRWLDQQYPGWRNDGGTAGIIAGEHATPRRPAMSACSVAG